ncbi:hypothetical protein Cylst_5236 [Cylindrospermum stagnale PCC 7417]|uniref:Uncharacterized protein n=1 Tax=Cylindrospermum stagnale PCC 7417 TaxID=56107 RepID=K9X3N8_9NOST|nr:hypothetical protein [Cylindrospermum stagnale]AFZ27270.1 hypothetical protein Cylst_5236 [Cylindrospermum stagnale PCC 7417]
MARKGGNPDLRSHCFTVKEEPKPNQLLVRMSDNMYAVVKSKENPSEYVRQAIAEKMEREGEAPTPTGGDR